MAYYICKQGEIPMMDTLPIYKIINYPLQNNGYKPFAQAKLCINDTKLIIEMLAFEMFPKQESELKTVISSEKSDAYIDVTATATQKLCIADSRGNSLEKSQIRYIKGEDLQGCYWGMIAEISLDELQQAISIEKINIGDSLMCNFYKLSDNVEKAHIGSMYPLEYSDKNSIYKKENLANFEVIKYGNI